MTFTQCVTEFTTARWCQRKVSLRGELSDTPPAIVGVTVGYSEANHHTGSDSTHCKRFELHMYMENKTMRVPARKQMQHFWYKLLLLRNYIL